MANLTNAPLIMIWRRVLDLPRAKRTTQRVNGWHEVGEDGFSVMYDAGNVLLSYWNQAQLLTEEQKPASTKVEAVAVSPCSGVVKVQRAEALNPSNQLTLVTQDTETTRQRLSSLAGHPINSAQLQGRVGTFMSVIDDVGNTTRYLRLSGAAGTNKLGLRLKSLQDSGFLDAEKVYPAVSYELLVRKLEVARKFYGDVLGLREESTVKDEAVFDTGNLFLTLRREPAAGLLKIVRQAGKLADDLIVFHAKDLEKTMSELSAKGVVFPKGIEVSPSGRLALFEDPDGHSLCVWQPPARNAVLGIDFFPVLDRLLSSASANLSLSS